MKDAFSPSLSWPALGELAQSWLMTLLWLSATATAVFLLIFLLLRLVPTRFAAFRHGLLTLVLLRLVLPPQLESPWSLWTLLEGWRSETTTATALWPAGDVSILMHHEPRAGGAADPDPASRSQSPWAWIFVFWGLGAATTGWWLARLRRPYRALLDKAEPINHGPVYQLTERYRGLFRIRRPVQVVTSEAAVVPFTMGIRRPRIFIPSILLDPLLDPPQAAPGSSEGQALLESILAHELAHIQRFDDLWLRCQHAVQAVYFFHPLVWITSRAMHHERELDCDLRAIRTTSSSPRGYGETFLRLLSLDLSPSVAASAFAGRRRLQLRLKNILEIRPDGPTHRRRHIWLLSAIGLLVLPWAISGEPQTPESSETATSQTPQTATASSELTLFDLMPGARITSTFGPRIHPTYKKEMHHDGVDLSTGAESSIFAPRGGVVKVATDHYAPSPDMGKVVIIDHGGGIETLYAHLATIAVKAKSGVGDGELLGTAGESGVATAPHLHFEIRKDGELVDPAGIAEWIGDC